MRRCVCDSPRSSSTCMAGHRRPRLHPRPLAPPTAHQPTAHTLRPCFDLFVSLLSLYVLFFCRTRYRLLGSTYDLKFYKLLILLCFTWHIPDLLHICQSHMHMTCACACTCTCGARSVVNSKMITCMCSVGRHRVGRELRERAENWRETKSYIYTPTKCDTYGPRTKPGHKEKWRAHRGRHRYLPHG